MIASKLVSKLVGSCLLINFLLSMNAFSAPLDTKFPYAEPPKGDVCVNNDQFATPETMLGSWAMLKAVDSDIQKKQLPALFSSKNDVAYAVGTAAIGDALGIPNCAGGCNQLNGFCFALKFNNKDQGPKYLILQSVNIAANANSFDIYMAGGGAGAFPNFCSKFWGNNSANWSANIENYQSCNDYFNYDNISSKYAVTYQGVTYTAKDTLKNACEYATQTGFNRQNFSNVSVVPVTCPQSLTQITGLKLSDSIKTVGKHPLIALTSLTDNDFYTRAFTVPETTQMQDCKTPSSGYCNNVKNAEKDYQASLSVSLDKPLLTGKPSENGQGGSGTYCQQKPATKGFCSWNNGNDSGSDYCNQSESICKSCGNGPKWCVCNNGVVECH